MRFRWHSMSAICGKVGTAPLEEQLSLKLPRFIEAATPELTVEVRVEKRR